MGKIARTARRIAEIDEQADEKRWQENNAFCAGCERIFPPSELSPDEAARAAEPGNMTEWSNFYCPRCLAGRGTTALTTAAKVIDGIGAGLRAAVEREAMWRSTLRENYDDDFGQWLAYSDMYGLAAKLGFATAEEAWEVNPTIQGSTDPRDFRVVPEGEQLELQLNAVLGWDPCEECGSNKEPCDCRRRPEAKQPDLTRAIRAARDNLDMGDLVIKESPPSMGGMDVYRKGPDYPGDQGDLDKVTFLNELGMEALGEWITEARRAARRIATPVNRAAVLVWDPATGKSERRAPAKPVPVDRDVDVEGLPTATCPRCKGHGGTFPADEGESCNLCDGHGEVYDHGGGVYSNETDRDTYLY